MTRPHPSLREPSPPQLSRRRLLGLGAGASAATLVALTGCTPGPAAGTTSLETLADPTWPLPDDVPAGVGLTIGDPATRRALELSGLGSELTFPVTWANITGGPDTSEAFRAGALDLGLVAEIPGINAHWTGLATKFVAARYRKDPLAHPIYQLGVAPGVPVTSLGDLRDKRVAYSPSQAQGALVVRVLAAAGLTRDDVTLVEIPSTGDVYVNALASGQVDVAPLGGTAVRRLLAGYGAEGATTIPHGLRDDPTHLYAPAEVLQDQGKAAAVAAYVRVWARAQQWVQDHPQEWVHGYHVADQRLSVADGEYLVEAAGELDLPADWTEPVARTQQTADLLADFLGRDRLDAGLLFDRRFESVAADALTGAGA